MPCLHDIDVIDTPNKHLHDSHFPGFVQTPKRTLRGLASCWAQIVK